jgi:hypothetical protein
MDDAATGRARADGEAGDFARDGFFIVRGLFATDEIALLRRAIEEDPALRASIYERKDNDKLATRMALWNHPGESVYGLAARSRRIVDRMEALLGDEVYHYHSKLTAKEPYEGGAWEWHQDYGYWYNNGNPFPLMASVQIALDRTTRENGCLEVLAGSHQAGRIDHVKLEGGQVGADLQRVAWLAERLPTAYAEMEPGDGIFFHCNLLHRSAQNRSPHRRWTLICCYNARRNSSPVPHHHPSYTRLDKVEDEAILAAGVRFAASRDEFSRRSVHPPLLRS